MAPAQVPEPWRTPVAAAVAARARYQEVVARAVAGPVRERLVELGGQVDAGVLAAWGVATRATEMTEALRAIDVAGATAEHKAAQRELQAARERGDVSPAVQARADALAARHGSAHRLQNSLEDAAEQLSVIEVRLEACVARAAELAFSAGASADPLAADLEAVVGELGALRQALEGL